MKRCEDCPYFGKHPIYTKCPVPKELPPGENPFQLCAEKVATLIMANRYRSKPAVVTQADVRASILRRIDP